jgi:hypothetical protein
MIITLNVAERNIQNAPPNVIVLPAATATVLIPDSRNAPGPNQVAYRRIQNVGNDNLYLSFGVTTLGGGPLCDPVANFHKIIIPLQEIDLSSDRQIVCGYSVAGTSAAIEVKTRLSP